MKQPTQEEFDLALFDLVREMYDNNPADILTVPGVYEIMAEYLNNEVLERIEEEQAEDMEEATWITIFEDEQGQRWISDSDDKEMLADSESDLTESDVYYSETDGYVHSDGTPIMTK